MEPIYTNPQVPTVEQIHRTHIFIWAGILMSQVMFLLVIYFVKPELFGFSSAVGSVTVTSPIVYLLAFFGLATCALSFILKNRFLKLAIENKAVGLVQTAYILAYALCEATTLFGLVAAFAFNFSLFFVWFIGGIIGIVLHFPRRESFQAAAFTGLA